MLAPVILGLFGIALVAYHLNRGHRLGPALRLVFDVVFGLIKAAGFACYIIAPQQVRPRRRVRVLPRPEIPTRRIFRRSVRIR